MLNNTINFLFFVSVVVLIYYCIPNINSKRIFLTIASAFLLFLINYLSLLVAFLLATFNYFAGKLIEKKTEFTAGKIIFIAALVINILNLFFLKIYFFSELSGTNINLLSQKDTIQLNHIIFPIGLSFYTFSILGYLIDIRLNFVKAEKDFFSFINFIFFFPKILAGPIERIQHFIPQSHEEKKLRWNNFSIGGKLIIWGAFQKLVIADRIDLYVDTIYSNIEVQSGITIIVCIVFYAFQIYSDFSGYTNIARGVARFFGYDLFENFQRPLLSGSISNFWRRWHISLFSWVKEYIYSPLSLKFRNFGLAGTVISLFISFFIIGIWHGFLWTFVLFGIVQGILITFEFLTLKWSGQIIKQLPAKIIYGSGMILTFTIISFTLVLFRAPTLHTTLQIFKQVIVAGKLYVGSPAIFIYILSGIAFLLCRDILVEFFKKDILTFRSKYFLVRSIPYALLIIMILLFGVFDGGQFIYLQF